MRKGFKATADLARVFLLFMYLLFTWGLVINK